MAVRTFGALGLGFALGAISALAEAAVILFVLDLDYPHAAAEVLGLQWRYGLTLAVAHVALAWGLRRQPLWRTTGVTSGLTVLVFLGWVVHRRFLPGVRIWEPTSIAATCAVVGVAAAAYGLVSRLGRSSLRAPVLVLTGALVVSPTILVCTGNEIAARERSRGSPGKYAGSDITLVVIDTLRKDRLSVYGHEVETSPALDRVAQSGTIFDTCIAQSSWTRPSMASLHTGTYASSHRVIEYYDVLPESATTLAELLRGKGYRTGAFSANANISPTFGFDQGFDFFWNAGLFRFMDQTIWGKEIEQNLLSRRLNKGLFKGNDAEALTTRVIEWLDEGSDRPVFTYVHYIDPHFPYDPPEYLLPGPRPSLSTPAGVRTRPFPFGHGPAATDAALQSILSLYDGEIRYTDRALERLLKHLTAVGLLDEDDYLIVTSDHGEQFYEHQDWGHGRSLFNEEIAVPLIVVGPGIGVGRRISDPVRLLDLYATIADWVGVKTPGALPTRTLHELLEGRIESDPRPAYSELLRGFQHYSLQVGTAKMIAMTDEERPGERLYVTFDLARNPGERLEVAPPEDGQLLDRSDPAFAVVPELLALLEATRDAAIALCEQGPSVADPPAAVLRQLQGLGYTGDD